MYNFVSQGIILFTKEENNMHYAAFLPFIVLNFDLAILSKNNSPAALSTLSGGT